MVNKTCIQCGKEFELTDDEISFYNSKGLELPKRCKDCRKANKKKKFANRKYYNNKKKKNSNEEKKDEEIRSDAQSFEAFEKSPTVEKKKRSEALSSGPEGKALDKNSEGGQGKKTSFGKIGAIGALAAVFIAGISGGVIANNNKETLLDDPSAVVSNVSELSEEKLNEHDRAIDEALDKASKAATEANENEEGAIRPDTENIVFTFRNEDTLNSHYNDHGLEMGFESPKEYEKAADKVIHDPKSLYKTEAEDGDHVYYLEDSNEFVIVSLDGYIRTYFYPDGGKDYFDRQ